MNDAMEEMGSTYSDYDQEILDVNGSATAGENTDVEVQFEPFRRRGGLDNDEVAELVHMRLGISYGPDQTATGQIFEGETRGVFGGNLDIEDLPAGNNDGNPNQYKTVDGDIFEGGTQTFKVADIDETGVFSSWDLFASEGGPVNMFHEIDFRDKFGRGPVFDASDDLSAVFRVISSDGTDANGDFGLRAQLYWDTATVDGVRNDFSIPERLE